jgi:hypothetical protein
MKPTHLRKSQTTKTSPRRRERKPGRQKDIVEAGFDAFAARWQVTARILRCKNELTMRSIVAILLF